MANKPTNAEKAKVLDQIRNYLIDVTMWKGNTKCEKAANHIKFAKWVDKLIADTYWGK